MGSHGSRIAAQPSELCGQSLSKNSESTEWPVGAERVFLLEFVIMSSLICLDLIYIMYMHDAISAFKLIDLQFLLHA